MRLDESRLKQLRQQGARPASRDGCLSADLLAMAAANTLPSSDRARVADHLAACADCAEELQLVQPLQAWAARTAEDYGHAPRPATERGSFVWAWQLASLILVVAVGGLLAWNVALRSDNAGLMARAEPTAGVAVPSAPPSVSGEVNVPIIDLQADVLRGGAPARAVVTVPADAALVTLILNSDSPSNSPAASRGAAAAYGIEVVNEDGLVVWHSDALQMTPYNTFTLAVSPRSLGAGLFHLQLLRVIGDRREPLERYSLRVEGR